MADLFIPGPVGRLSVRTKGLDPRPNAVVLLVQGANMTGQTGYDFQHPGGFSLMDTLVAAGYGAVTFSVRGYGLSDAPADPNSVQTAQGIEDLEAVAEWLRATHGYARQHLLGWSWGGRIAGQFAERRADLADRLICLNPAFGGADSIGEKPTDPWFTGTAQWVFDHLEPEVTDVGFRDAIVAWLRQHEPRSPNGIRMENFLGSPATRPEAISRPTLIVTGDAGGRANYMTGTLPLPEFFVRLGTDDRLLAVLPGGNDYLHVQAGRHKLAHLIVSFLRMGAVA